MSRVGLTPITVPQGVEVTINGAEVTIKGPKGTLSRELDSHVKVILEDSLLRVERESDKYKALHGLTRSLLANMVTGVTEGYEKKLEIKGVGYRAAKQGNKLVLTIGYSHPIEFMDNEDVKTEVPDQTTILVKGIDNQKVGQVAADIRAKRPPEPYKGKGIKYEGERILRKEGKAGAKK
ncbi:MAG: 50S ribosomal protein L6 [Clostridia bacterium]|nr:50S ribosomal protein L6 [Clostridia bacterium]MDD4376260.1 50S ribosomal protein L6 [Clostridia bacterium]